MVLITFASPFLLLDVIDDRLYPPEPPRQVCRGHHQHFDPFQDINWIHDEKCHPRPMVIWVTIDNIFTFLSSLTCTCYGCNLLSSSYYILPWRITTFLSRMLWEFHHLLRILVSVILHHHHSFLGPRVVPNRNTDRWTSNFKKLLAALLLWS